jgi:hypothetical protein
MHIDDTSRQYTTADGKRHTTRCLLLRTSHRDKNGKPRNETLANLSALPDNAIAALKLALKGATLVVAESVFEVERSIPHGDVAAAHVMAQSLDLRALLGPPGRGGDIAYALILSQAVHPRSMLSAVRWWNTGDTTLAADLGVAGACADDVHDAMNRLLAQKGSIETELSRRHLRRGGAAMYDLCSSWLSGNCRELAAFGYSRYGRRGRMHVEYGLRTDLAGRPVSVDVFARNTADAVALRAAVDKARTDCALKELVFAGDRAMITTTRIGYLRELKGAGWVTAMKAPDIAALSADDRPPRMPAFDERNLAEITHPGFPGERLVCRRNPVLAESSWGKREALLADTEADLEQIRKSTGAGRLTDKDKEKISVRVGKVIGRHTVGKHFAWEITDSGFTFRRDEERIAAESRLDGISMIRTSMSADTADAATAVKTYQNLKHVRRDFKTIEIDDLDARPIRLCLPDRIEAHLLIRMLAAYLSWHLREALAPLTFAGQDTAQPADLVTPAMCSHRDVIRHLATLGRQVVIVGGQKTEKLTSATPVQARAFELLGVPVPARLA